MRKLFGAAVVALSAALMFPVHAQERRDPAGGEIHDTGKSDDPRIDDPLTLPNPAAGAEQTAQQGAGASQGTGGGAQAGGGGSAGVGGAGVAGGAGTTDARGGSGAPASPGAPTPPAPGESRAPTGVGEPPGRGAPPIGQLTQEDAANQARQGTAGRSGQAATGPATGQTRQPATEARPRATAQPAGPAREARPRSGTERPEDSAPPRDESGRSGARPPGSEMTTIQQSSLDFLHRRISELEQENDMLRARVGGATTAGGGAGTGAATGGAGGGAPATGGSGAGGSGGGGSAGAGNEAASAPPRAYDRAPATTVGRDTAPAGTPVVSVDFVGVIHRVLPGRVDVFDEEGNVFDLRVNPRTRALRDGQRIPVAELQEGTPVRASFDQIAGRSHARELEVLPAEEVRGLNLPGMRGQGARGATAAGQDAQGQQGQNAAQGEGGSGQATGATAVPRSLRDVPPGGSGALSNREQLLRQPAMLPASPPGTRPLETQATPPGQQPAQPREQQRDAPPVDLQR